MPDKPLLITSGKFTKRMHDNMREYWEVVFWDDIDLDDFVAKRGEEVKGQKGDSARRKKRKRTSSFNNFALLSLKRGKCSVRM